MRRDVERIAHEEDAAEEQALNHISIIPSVPSFRRTHMSTAAEEEMWAEFDMEDVVFSAGVQDNMEADEWCHIEREMDAFGIWNGGLLGRELGAKPDEFQMNDFDEEIMEQMMRDAHLLSSFYS